MLVSYEIGQKNVLLNNYLYDFNMVSIWFAIYEAGKSPLADYDSTLISLCFHYDFYYDFTMALLTPNFVILEFVNKI